jgi:hypothetical protein
MRNLFLLSLALTATGANAQARGGTGLSSACRTEVVTLCPRTGDRDARRACMMEKRAQISDGCKSELMAMRAARQAQKVDPADVIPATPPKQ